MLRKGGQVLVRVAVGHFTNLPTRPFTCADEGGGHSFKLKPLETKNKPELNSEDNTFYSFNIEIQGQSMHYIQSSPKPFRKSKTILLFMHPFALRHSVWKYQWSYFSKEYPLFALDLPGFGSSPLPKGVEASPKYYQKVVSEFIETLKISSLILIGNSLGGAVCLSLYEILFKKIKGMILIDALTHDGFHSGIFKRLAHKLSSRSSVYKASRLIAPFVPVKSIVNIFFRVAIEKSMDTLQDEGFKTYIEAYYREPRSMSDFLNVCRFLGEWDMLETVFPLVNVPTLICWGEHDRVLPLISGKLLHTKIPGSEFVVFPKTGHMAYLEDPQNFNEKNV